MIRRLRAAARPTETRFFLFLGAFGLVLAAIYWVLTYELAGTVLLAGFGIGALLLGVVLVLDKRGRTDEAAMLPNDADTPFGDDRGRLPSETLAPLALGLGVALSLTSVVFGPWLVVAGIVPLAWGAWSWVSGARDELDATVAHDRAGHGNAGADGSGVSAGR